ncbi:MAG: hypothetical protein AAF791_05040 [Bacteroidota bacterium]
MRPLAFAFVLLATTASAQTGCASATDGEATSDPAPDTSQVVETREITAGETAVMLVTEIHAPSAENREVPPAMLNVHDNERTSVDAALDVVRETGGLVMHLTHTGDRNLTFEVDGRSYTADPNRMFTAIGRERTLSQHSTASPAALDALAAFADEVLAAYTALDPAVVVALHNNTDERYSVASYLPGADYASDAADVTLHEGTDPDDFFFVTDRALFDALTARGFNAVLQDNDAATDDGSLSVWAAQNNRPYVNVEAQHGHREEQARMIRALVEVLAAR